MSGIRCQYKFHCFSQPSLLHSQHRRLIYHFWNPLCIYTNFADCCIRVFTEIARCPITVDTNLVHPPYQPLSHCKHPTNISSPTPQCNQLTQNHIWTAPSQFQSVQLPLSHSLSLQHPCSKELQMHTRCHDSIILHSKELIL